MGALDDTPSAFEEQRKHSQGGDAPRSREHFLLLLLLRGGTRNFHILFAKLRLLHLMVVTVSPRDTPGKRVSSTDSPGVEQKVIA